MRLVAMKEGLSPTSRMFVMTMGALRLSTIMVYPLRLVRCVGYALELNITR